MINRSHGMTSDHLPRKIAMLSENQHCIVDNIVDAN